MEVRRATEDDLPGVVECSAALFAEDAGTRDPYMNADWPRQHGMDRFRQTLRDDGRLLLVAANGTEIVGHLAGVIEEPTAIQPVRGATLISMFVRPARRGQNIGARLTQAFLEWAKEQGAQRAEVTAYQSNQGAIRFYERNGFKPQSVTLEQPL